VSDERLDLPDFNAVSSLAQTSDLVGMGGAIGPWLIYTAPFGGCASAITPTWDGPSKFLTIPEGLFFQGGVLASPATAPSGRFIAYDPVGSAAQIAAATGVDLTGEAAGSTTCIIWATRSTTESTLEMRKRWLPGATAESSFATNTRTVEIVTFDVRNATFNGSGQVTAYAAPLSDAWFPVFKITAWPAGVPTVGSISYWDGTNTLAFVGDPSTKVDSLGGPGIGAMLYYLRKQLARLYDSTEATSWLTFAGGGVSQINTALTAALANIATLQKRAGLGTVTGFTASKPAGTWIIDGLDSDVRVLSIANPSAGVFNIVIGAGYMAVGAYSAIKSVVVTLQSSGAVPSPAVLSSSEITDSVTGTFTIRFFDTAGTPTDPSNNGFNVIVAGL
jgi:hypothetical protein